ncbi:MAG: 4'-phosphopantetheinyl transferase family protein [Syntrophothermus sp.]
MPLIRKEKLTNETLLGIWKIEESAEELKSLQKLSIPEELFYAGLKNETRKKHWLSYRLIIKDIPGIIGPVSYDDFGKPSLPNSGHRISVSHSGDYSAVMVSKDAEPGIDIEQIRERIERVKERFLSKRELRELGEDDYLKKLYVCWGIKEAVFKVHGKPDIEFSQDIYIHPFDYQPKGTCEATLGLNGKETRFSPVYEEIENYMLVYTWIKKEG